MTGRLTPFGALAELHRQDLERGIDPRSFTATPSPTPASTLPPTIREVMAADRPDWRAHDAERRAHERRAEPTATPVAELEREPPPPAPKRWRREQLKAAA
jgi:hypothetical protein